MHLLQHVNDNPVDEIIASTSLLISTDLLLEGIHFNLIYTPLKHLGYKAVIRAISDIYAMNGTPGQVLIGLGNKLEIHC